MKIRKEEFTVENILIVIFAAAYMISRFTSLPMSVGNILVALSGLLCFAYVIIKKGMWGRTNSVVILIAILLTASMILSIIYNSNANLSNILWIWSYCGVALLVGQFHIETNVLYGIFYANVIIFMGYAIVGVNPDQVINTGSGNNISVVLLAFMLLAYLESVLQNKRLSYIPALVTVILSLWGNGRAGLLASVFFLVMLFVYNFLAVKKGKIKNLVVVFVLSVIVIYIVQYFFGDSVELFLYKLDRYGTDSARFEIWREYINGMFENIGNFCFGINTTSLHYPTLKFYSGNTHNAFLMLHAKYGLVGFLCYLIIIIKAYIKMFKRKNVMYIIIFTTIVIRSFFDWTGFPGIFDVFFWYMLIYCLDSRK